MKKAPKARKKKAKFLKSRKAGNKKLYVQEEMNLHSASALAFHHHLKVR